MKLKSLLTSLLALMIIPLVSAQSLSEQFFENEWVLFGIVFIILFATMFSFFKQRFHGSAAPATAVSGGLSVLLSMAIMQRGILDRIVGGFLGETIVDWIVIIALAIAIFFLLRWFWSRLRFWGIILLILILGVLTYFFEEYIPETLMFGPFGTFVEWIQGLSAVVFWITLVVIVVILIWKLFFRRKWERRQAGLMAGAQEKGKRQALRGSPGERKQKLKQALAQRKARQAAAQQQTQQQAQAQQKAQQQTQAKQNQQWLNQMRKQYNHYSKVASREFTKAKGIPKKGTPGYNKWNQARLRRQSIEKEAARRGLRL